METFNKVILKENPNRVVQTVDNTSIDAVTSQVEKFDNSYSSDKIRSLMSELDNITISDTDLKLDSITQNNVLTQSTLTYKTKLYLSLGTIVALLLSFLAIYNIFVINNLNSNISILQDSISEQYAIFQSIEGEYIALTSTPSADEIENLRAMGYTEITSENFISMNVAPKVNVQQLRGTTNWFDGFCNFLSRLFGGS